MTPRHLEERDPMKKNIDIARAWRDEDYYMSLTEEERASLGDHPAGVVDVADEVLTSIAGGCGKTPATTVCGNIYCF
jgi:mersacidin/lichenicidin family type 2 lantibiotic